MARQPDRVVAETSERFGHMWKTAEGRVTAPVRARDLARHTRRIGYGVIHHTPRWARLAPYRHCTTPWSVAKDLYDRLAAPLEFRYSRESAERLLRDAGFEIRRVAQQRGWMLWARKPPAGRG